MSYSLACEQAPKWGLGRSGGERGGGGKRREGACGHSFDAAVSPPCNFTCKIISHMPIIHARSVWNVNKIRAHVSYLPGKVEMEKCMERICRFCKKLLSTPEGKRVPVVSV